MQIKPGLFPPVMLGAVMFCAAARNEHSALAWEQQASERGDKGKAEYKIQDFSFKAWMRKKYSENSQLYGLVLKPHQPWCVHLSITRWYHRIQRLASENAFLDTSGNEDALTKQIRDSSDLLISTADKIQLQDPNKPQVEYTSPLQRTAVLMSLSCCKGSGCY